MFIDNNVLAQIPQFRTLCNAPQYENVLSAGFQLVVHSSGAASVLIEARKFVQQAKGQFHDLVLHADSTGFEAPSREFHVWTSDIVAIFNLYSAGARSLNRAQEFLLRSCVEILDSKEKPQEIKDILAYLKTSATETYEIYADYWESQGELLNILRNTIEHTSITPTNARFNPNSRELTLLLDCNGTQCDMIDHCSATLWSFLNASAKMYQSLGIKESDPKAFSPSMDLAYYRAQGSGLIQILEWQGIFHLCFLDVSKDELKILRTTPPI